MSDPYFSETVRTRADGTDERIQSKIVGNASSPTPGALAENQAIVDSFGRLLTAASATITSEQATAADGGTLPAVVKVAGGYDGVNVQVLHTDTDGDLQIDVLSSALPTGASTEAKQDAGNASLASIDSDIDVALSTRASESTLSAFQSANHTDLLDIQTKQDTGNASLASIDSDIDVALSTRASEATLAAFESANHVDLLAIKVDIDSTNTKLDTIHSDLVTIEAKQDIGNASLASIDSDIDIALSTRASEATLASFEAANHTDLLAIKTDIDSTNTKLDTIHSDLVTIEGKQDIGNASLASIDSDIDVALSTRASETTLAAFESANHTDLVGVQTRIDTANAHLTNIEGYVDGIEGKLDTVNANLVTIEGKQDTGNASLASIDADIDVALSTRASESTLSAFKTANHTDILAVQTRQDTGNASLASIDSDIDVALSTRASEVTLAKLTQTQGSTTSGQSGPLVQGAVTTAAPSYTTGKTDPLSLTTAGALRTDSSGTTQPVSGTVTATQGTSPWVENVSQFGGSNVVTGTGVSGSGIPRVTVSSDSSVSVSGNVTVVQPTGTNLHTVVDSGTVTANIGTTGGLALDATVSALQVSQASTTAAQKGTLIQGAVTTAAPSYTTGQTDPLSLTTAGALRTDSSATTQPISGTVAATQSGTWNITNVSGTVSLPTGAATEATLAKLPIAQSTALGSTSGPLIQGSVTTAAPTYTTGNINPLSLTTAGLLRVDTSGATGLVSTKTDLTPSSPTFATVGVASAQALASNANRKGLILTNTSIATISIGLGSTAVLNSGIVLYPGGTFQMDEFCYDTGAVNAIASLASSNLGIQEFTT